MAEIFYFGLVPAVWIDYLEYSDAPSGMAGEKAMIRYLVILLFLCAPGLAAAQVGNGVNMGLNGDNDSMYGPAIDMVDGTNANGTPRQLLPGASMTNGAGNSYMTPGVTGGPVVPPRIFAPPAPVTVPTLQGQAGGTAAPAP